MSGMLVTEASAVVIFRGSRKNVPQKNRMSSVICIGTCHGWDGGSASSLGWMKTWLPILATVSQKTGRTELAWGRHRPDSDVS